MNSSAFRSSGSSAFRMFHFAVSKLTWIVVFAVGTGFARTSTLAESVRCPPAPFAVSVYRVVLDGQTCFEPFASTVPTPGSIDTLVAFDVDQVRVAQEPASTD